MLRVGFDAMGGDFAPEKAIEGLYCFINETGENRGDFKIVIFGDYDKVYELLKKYGIGQHPLLEVVHCSEVIEMGEAPVKAVATKKDSSIIKGMQALKEGKIDVFASAGNSGAIVAGAVQVLGLIEQISRPSFLLHFTKPDGRHAVIVDVGGVPDCKPNNFIEFAVLGILFLKHVYGVEEPVVGLINIGEEPSKGNSLYKSVHALLAEATFIKFAGNVEPRGIFNTPADVLVCDGFTGNIIIKLAEAIYELIAASGVKVPYLENLNYQLKGGTIVAGPRGNVVVGHGISNERAFASMLKAALHFGIVNFHKVVAREMASLRLLYGLLHGS